MTKRNFVFVLGLIFIIAGTSLHAAIQMPPMTERTLGNGLKVIVVENHEQPVVSMNLLIRSGTAMDGLGKAGLANMTAGLLRKGTATRDATKISQEIDFVGGSIGASSEKDATNVTCSVLTKHFDVGLDLLADIVLNPSFPEAEIERLRKQTMAGLMAQKDDPNAISDQQYAAYLFGEHPYAQPASGTIESVSGLERDDIAGYWSRNFLPNNAVLFVAGDVTADAVLAKIEGKFGGWKRGELPQTNFPPANPVKGNRVVLINKSDATNANINMGHLGIDRYNPDIYAVRTMNYILGGGGFRSRLMTDIRDKRGLTYGINSQYSFDRYPGAFTVSVATNVDSAAQSIAATIEHLRQIQAADVTAQELSETKSFYAGYLPRQFETPMQVASQLSVVELYGLEKDYFSKYIDYMQAVTPQQVRLAAQKYISPDNLLIVVVGNAEKLRDALKQFGPITELDLSEI